MSFSKTVNFNLDFLGVGVDSSCLPANSTPTILSKLSNEPSHAKFEEKRVVYAFTGSSKGIEKAILALSCCPLSKTRENLFIYLFKKGTYG